MIVIKRTDIGEFPEVGFVSKIIGRLVITLTKKVFYQHSVQTSLPPLVQGCLENMIKLFECIRDSSGKTNSILIDTIETTTM